MRNASIIDIMPPNSPTMETTVPDELRMVSVLLTAVPTKTEQLL